MKKLQRALCCLAALLLTACQPTPQVSSYNQRAARDAAQETERAAPSDAWRGYDPYQTPDEPLQVTLETSGQRIEIDAEVHARRVDQAYEIDTRMEPVKAEDQLPYVQGWLGEAPYTIYADVSNFEKEIITGEQIGERACEYVSAQDDDLFIRFERQLTLWASRPYGHPMTNAYIGENLLTREAFERMIDRPVGEVRQVAWEALEKLGLADQVLDDPLCTYYGKTYQPFCVLNYPRLMEGLPAWCGSGDYGWTPNTIKESAPQRQIYGQAVQVNTDGAIAGDVQAAFATPIAKRPISTISFAEAMDAFQAQFYIDPPVWIEGRMKIVRIELAYIGQDLVDDAVGPDDVILTRRWRPAWVFTSSYSGQSHYQKTYFIDGQTGEIILTGK